VPLLITYQGRPIKRRRRVGNKLLLVFYAAQAGQRGDKLIVSQANWEAHGSIQYVARNQMPDVRRMSGS
jgi:hypothetical protein